MMDDTSSKLNIISSARTYEGAIRDVVQAAEAIRDDLIRLPPNCLKPEEIRLIAVVDCYRKLQEARKVQGNGQ